MYLDEKYKNGLIACIGDAATEWFEKLPEILKQCKEKWKLSNIKPYDDLSYNYVCSGKSEIYGEVVLKVGFPHKELYTEMDALKDFNDGSVCKLYDSCKVLNAMILEIAVPGDTLWSIKAHNEKIRIAAHIINSVPIKIKDTSKYPYHCEWIQKAFLYLREHYEKNHPMCKHMDMVENIYEDLNVEGNSKLLLHGDLHHSNILRIDSHWKVIDPKGVIGYKSLEVGRFMNNQYGVLEKKERRDALDFMIKEFSEVLGFSKEVILKSFYIDLVLSSSWFFDEEEINMNYVDETNPEDLVNTSINSMLKSLDPYTTYISESEMDDFNFH